METSQEKIFELYIQHLSGTLSAEEESYVQRQLQNDPAFYAEWQLLSKEAANMHAGDYLQRIDSSASLEQVKQHRALPVARPVITWRRIATAAAVVVLLIGSGAVFFLINKRHPAPLTANALLRQAKEPVKLVLGQGQTVVLGDSTHQTIALNNATLNTSQGALQYTSADTMLNTLEVPVGETYKLALSDGTEVWLNAATRLRFPFMFGQSTREVYVEGEAYFSVAKDARRPFVVRTALTQVQVLGTAFNINTYQAGMVKTSLVSGKVVTSAKDGAQQPLSPGIQADYNAAAGFTTSHFDEEEVLSWRDGVYYYHHMPLAALLSAASRFYGVRFVLDQEKMAGKSVTGLMDRKRLEDFLSDLKTTAHIDYQVVGNEITLR
ncbi:FecR family protein [Chitinophaga polysaccharea]|uniref:FecR family protein n=1 Tax=Chitinophaga polysaccharea TaxID=1293035 RepID=A0A561PCN7_9BACT|nr:FecR domain-containing protein [Chitinophaga polysaccharea]TWF35887.1 FecR family protein [Chitinophaga polysaccharea]